MKEDGEPARFLLLVLSCISFLVSSLLVIEEIFVSYAPGPGVRFSFRPFEVELTIAKFFAVGDLLLKLDMVYFF